MTKEIQDRNKIGAAILKGNANLDLHREALKVYRLAGLSAALELIEKGKGRPEYSLNHVPGVPKKGE